MDLETKVEVLSERVSNLTDQLKRFISHLESEQRVTGEISKRVDQLEKELEFLQIQFTQKSAQNKWRLEVILSILALLISASTSIVSLLMK